MDSERPGGHVPTIAGFEHLEKIGAGGFAVVYSASEVALNRRVALKVLSFDSSDQRRFERECRILGSLSTVPGVVPIHQATSTDSGAPVIVMPLMERGSLTSRLQSGPMPPARVAEMGIRLANALQSAHERGIFHRDIKPANVLFDDRDEPAIADFGISLIRDMETSTDTIESLSPPHAPPERFLGLSNSDPRLGDVYSLGSTLYTALSGGPPFGTAAQGGLAGLLRRVSDDPVPPIRLPDVPAHLEAALAKSMSKDPADRFPDMKSFADALSYEAPVAAFPPGGFVPGDLPGQSKRPLVIGLAAVALLVCVVVIAAVSLLRHKGEDRDFDTRAAASQTTRAAAQGGDGQIPDETSHVAPVTADAELSCTFTGSISLAKALVPNESAANELTLDPGSGLSCGKIRGDFELKFAFDDLTTTAGTGNGFGNIRWSDGTSSSVTGTAELMFPDLQVNLLIVKGEHRGLSATVHFVSWTPTLDSDGNINGVTFLATAIDWS